MISSFAADLRCPDDGHLLRATDKGQVPFATCRHCDGLWFSREAIHGPRRATLPKEGKPSRKKRVSKRNRACPQCATRLKPEKVEGIVIDVCPKCGGVWLEPGGYSAARRRSVAMRLHKEAPFLRPRTGIGKVVERLVDIIGNYIIKVLEEKHEEPLLRLSLRPKPKRD